jgi:hypothetical protein
VRAVSGRTSIWTPARLEEVRQLRKELGGKLGLATSERIAAELSQRWGVSISGNGIRNAIWADEAKRQAVAEVASRTPAARDAREEPPPRDESDVTGEHDPVPGMPPPPIAPQSPRIARPPATGLPREELIEHRIRKFERKRAHEEARRLIPIDLPTDEPIGILHFGDPHLDDDGTDLAKVKEHGELVRNTPGLYGANLGDTTNNWIGRLARLYASQGTTAAEAWQLAEWFIRDLVGPKWLYMISGNHDAWSGAGDPLQWIAAGAGALYQDTEVRIELRFPGGTRIKIHCRHDFAGHSIYNPAHGPMRALQFGQRDHLAIAGHLHISAHGVLKDPETGITMNALRVASYKRFDAYARDKGLRDQSLSPCAVTVLDPKLPETHPDLVKVFWDPNEGAEFLTFKRLRARRGA